MIPAGIDTERTIVALLAFYLAFWLTLVALSVRYGPQWLVAGVIVAAFAVTVRLATVVTVGEDDA